MSTADAQALLERMEQSRYIRWTGDCCEITAKGRERMKAREA